MINWQRLVMDAVKAFDDSEPESEQEDLCFYAVQVFAERAKRERQRLEETVCIG